LQTISWIGLPGQTIAYLAHLFVTNKNEYGPWCLKQGDLLCQVTGYTRKILYRIGARLIDHAPNKHEIRVTAGFHRPPSHISSSLCNITNIDFGISTGML
jgi:hypothetical protein